MATATTPKTGKTGAVSGNSKLAQLLTSNKVDPRRILSASAKLEGLRREDRAIRSTRRSAKKAETKTATTTEKPRSGRPITPVTLANALAGKPLSGAAKTRLLRAVNHVLVQKKQTAVDLKTLF